MRTKGETRRLLRSRRREIVEGRDLAADAETLAGGLAPFVTALGGPSTVLSYESLPHEPPTRAVHATLQAAGHRVLVPITLPDWRLEWCEIGDLDRRPLGIESPHTADLALVPALAVDTTGTRLGQGGGCYDRVLPKLAREVSVLAVLHPGEHTTTPLPRDEHDIAVPTVLTALGATGATTPLGEAVGR